MTPEKSWLVKFNDQNTYFHPTPDAPPKCEGECTVIEVPEFKSFNFPDVAKPIYIKLNRTIQTFEVKSFKFQVYADQHRDTIERSTTISAPVIIKIIKSGNAKFGNGTSKKRSQETFSESSVERKRPAAGLEKSSFSTQPQTSDTSSDSGGFLE